MIALLLAHAVIGAALFPSGRTLGRRSFLIAALPMAATFVWLAVHLRRVLDGEVLVQHVDWVPSLGLGVDLRLDGFSALMVLLVSGIGVVVCLYSASYFPSTSAGLGRSAGLLVMFAAAMLVVVQADDLLLLYTGWELTSITSYLLIGNDHTKLRARAAALQALLITSLGGLIMLAGFVLVGIEAGTYRLSAILADPPSGTAVDVAVVLVLVGAFTKSAQYPFHSWLPGAMAAPTPISAYLHSATMVKAGVYLIARFSPAFAGAGVWRPVVLVVGATTMVAAALRALRQYDLKLLLAYGTVSQLGFLVLMFGLGTPAFIAAGCQMLLAHALFKAALFMGVGTVDRMTGTRDLRRIPALRPGWGLALVAVVASAASMAGVPLMFGFIAKESAFTAFDEAPVGGAAWVLVAAFTGSVLTTAYTCRFLWGVLGPPATRHAAADSPPPAEAPRRPGPGYVLPIAGLAATGLVLGCAPRLADGLITATTQSLDATAEPVHLALWHGVNLPLLLSAVAIAGGVALFVARRPADRVLARGARIPSGTTVYLRLLRGTNQLATRVTGVVQNGSLPVYAGVTLFVAAAVPAGVLITSATWPGLPRLAASPGQVVVVAVMLAAAIAAATTRRRFSAALFLGTVGYAMAGLFVVQGAPDLALTQVAIETVSTVVFVLVLRRLPDRFERTSSTRRRVVRIVVSASVAVTVFAFAIIARSAREAAPVSGEMIERSYPDGHGRNVVNVILVDIRGLDTMGEITVLAAAAIGAVALARARRPQPEPPGDVPA